MTCSVGDRERDAGLREKLNSIRTSGLRVVFDDGSSRVSGVYEYAQG